MTDVPATTGGTGDLDWPGDLDRPGGARAVLDQLPGAVLVSDRGFRCRYANRAALRRLGASDPAQVVGQTAGDLLEAEVWQEVLPHVRAALDGHAQELPRSSADPDGRTRHAQVSYRPYVLDGEVVGCLVVIADVTDRVEAELARRRDAEEAAVARERERVAGEASTLISRPLFSAALELSATLQGSTGVHRDRVRTAIQDIDTAVAQLRALVVGGGLPEPRRAEEPGAGRRDGPDAELLAVHVGDVLSTVDADGRYEWVSPSSVLVTGWAPTDLVGLDPLDLVHPEDRAAVRARWAGRPGGEELVGAECRRRRPDGTYQRVEARVRLLRGEDGRRTGAIESLRDVSERRGLQEQLVEALETFELSFAAAPIGKALVAADGRWLKVNPALAALVGRPRDELLRCTFQDITHPDDLDADLTLVGEVLRGERGGYEIQKRYLRPDGTAVRVLLSVAAARRRDGTFRFFIVQVQDLSRRGAGVPPPLAGVPTP